MGMYTELYLAVELTKYTREDIIQWMSKHNSTKDWHGVPEIAPEEVKNSRLDVLSGDSYYFDAIPVMKFKYDKISDSYYLTVIFNIKNYEDEIEKFLKLIEPYVISEGHVGHKRYEESDKPTLIYYDKKGFVFEDVEAAKVS